MRGLCKRAFSAHRFLGGSQATTVRGELEPRATRPRAGSTEQKTLCSLVGSLDSYGCLDTYDVLVVWIVSVVWIVWVVWVVWVVWIVLDSLFGSLDCSGS